LIKEVYEYFYLPSIDYSYKEILVIDKTKLTIFDVLVDDLADNKKIRDRKLLDESIRIPWSNKNKFKNSYLNIANIIWKDCIKSITNYPRYNEFKDIFFFDLNNIFSSMRYSYLSNEIGFDNYIEDEFFINHGVMGILHADMDIMCSPLFNKNEINKIRPILYWVQDIIHIGNLINTYPREVKEEDFSSPIISFGLRENIINRDIMVKDPKEALQKLVSVIPYFKDRVDERFRRIKLSADTIKSVDISEYHNRLNQVWNDFLKRENYWEISQTKISKKPVQITEKIPNYNIKWVRM
jgi:hypothetical protein